MMRLYVMGLCETTGKSDIHDWCGLEMAACTFVLLTRHGDAYGILRRDEMIKAHRVLGNGKSGRP